LKKENIARRTLIGGQALFEGIMMRGVGKAAMAVRKKDGEISIERWDTKKDRWYQKIPFIRGNFNFIMQMIDGYKYMTRSVELSGMMEDDEQAEEMSKFESWLNEKLGDKLFGVLMTAGMITGVAVALLLFMFVPTWMFTGLNLLFGGLNIQRFQSLFEGVIKITIFIAYLWGTSKIADIKRMYEYHGAEHKTIAAYEANEELVVENVRKHIRFHRRCGTSFIFLTLAISILVYSAFPINSGMFVDAFNIARGLADLIRVVFKILLLPVTVGISYEIIRIAGRHDNVFTRVVSAPGLAIQRLTTKEPDDSQIEIAIAAIKPVLPEKDGEDRW
jgi:uncharacterized protein YqhQ